MLAGIDIGGTKTQILTAEAPRPADVTFPTSAWRARSNSEEAVALLFKALLDITGGVKPSVLVAGAHGCDTDEDRLALQEKLARHLDGIVLVLNDSELLLPAAGLDAGISVIVGTGSIAVARNERREMITAGGWGWYLGDEGGASGLVREAARAVRGAIDRGCPLDPLGAGLITALELDSPIEIGRVLGEHGNASKIGSLAPLVFEAAEAGSKLALDVIAQGGKALAALVLLLAGRNAPGRHVVTGGGVITRQQSLYEAFRSELEAVAPQLSLALLDAPPATGALVLARSLRHGRLPGRLPLPSVAGSISDESAWRAA